MPITYIDGRRFKRASVAAAQRVLDAQERLNKINVFPIPDGDTGTNMALTLRSVADRALNTESSDLAIVSANMAEAALIDARGNSGSILAQFFQGFADAFQDKRRVNIEQFAAAARAAAACAERGISEPCEGTILTVIRDWARFIESHWNQTTDIFALLRDSMAAADRSLAATPEKLAVLKKAGVVDAGGQGFVNMLEGILAFIETGLLEYQPNRDTSPAEMPDSGFESATDIEYRYCTECLIVGEGIDLAKVREAAQEFGDSLIVAGNPRMTKIHVHTNTPESFFDKLAVFGTLKNQKAEDMRAQFLERERPTASNVALITDSSCDLPTDYMIRHKIRVVPAGVNIGSQSFLDRVTITSEEVYRVMEEGVLRPTTSQPSPAAFKRTYAAAADQHSQAVAIFLSSAVSATYKAGASIAAEFPDLNIRVIDSKTTTGTLGLLVRVAAESIAEGCDADEVARRVEAARPHARLFVLVKNMDYLIRGGRVSKVRGGLAKLLGLVPILTLDHNGKVAPVAKARAGQASRDKLLAVVKKASEGLKNVRFQICHAAAEEVALEYAEELKRHFGLDHVEILHMSPTMGAHVGPGTSAIAMLGEPAV